MTNFIRRSGNFDKRKFLQYWSSLFYRMKQETGSDVISMIASGKKCAEIQEEMRIKGYRPITEQAFNIFQSDMEKSSIVASNINDAVISFLRNNVSYVVRSEVVLESLITAGFATFLRKNKEVDLKTLLSALKLKFEHMKESDRPEDVNRKVLGLLRGMEDNGKVEPTQSDVEREVPSTDGTELDKPVEEKKEPVPIPAVTESKPT
jgi:predicted metalloprotease with PDZ domain